MQTINIITLFKQFMDSVVSDESKNCFIRYCLGGMYTYSEYIDILMNVFKSSGEGYTFKCVVFTERYNSSYHGINESIRTYLDSSSFYISDEKLYFAKLLRSFNFYLINPAFPFIILPKLYNYIHELEKDIHFNTEMIKLVKEWKKFFYPYIVDFCQFKEFYIPAKKRYVYKNKTELVVASEWYSKIENKDPNGRLIATYYPTNNVLHQMNNYA